MGQMEDDLRRLITERLGSVQELSRRTGVPAPTIYSALHSNIAGSSASNFLPIAQELDLDPFQLAMGKLVPTNDGAAIPVPLFGSISAGTPIEPDLADTTYPIPLRLHRRYPRAFLLRVEGESMNRILPNGCFALVSPQRRIDVSGKIYAMAVGENAATIKQVRLLENGIALEPSSTDPTFHPLVLDFTDPDTPAVSVIGRVVWYCMPPNWEPTLP